MAECHKIERRALGPPPALSTFFRPRGKAGKSVALAKRNSLESRNGLQLLRQSHGREKRRRRAEKGEKKEPKWSARAINRIRTPREERGERISDKSYLALIFVLSKSSKVLLPPVLVCHVLLSSLGSRSRRKELEKSHSFIAAVVIQKEKEGFICSRVFNQKDERWGLFLLQTA